MMLIAPIRRAKEEERAGAYILAIDLAKRSFQVYRTRAQAKADVFDYIERFYNLTRRHSTLGYVTPIDFEMEAGLA
jgi:transposase InsO family protein